MGCQDRVVLGANLTFTIATHDPDTGELTDTDFPPVFRVYRNEVAAPVLTGTMAKLDNANTTGFYSAQLTCVAANGFIDESSYNIYIEATVDGDTGGISYGFVARVGPDLCFDVLAANILGGYGMETANVGTAGYTMVTGNLSAGYAIVLANAGNIGYAMVLGNAGNLAAAASNTGLCP